MAVSLNSKYTTVKPYYIWVTLLTRVVFLTYIKNVPYYTLKHTNQGGCMSKIMIGSSFAAVTALILVPTLMPNSPVVWISSMTSIYQFVRIATALFLAVLLVTQPPRHTILRVMSAVLSVVLAIWTFRQTSTYQMEILDTLAFMAASITLFVTAIERKEVLPYTLPFHHHTSIRT